MVDFLSLTQAVLYAVTFILGFMVSISVGVTKAKFEGRCILYADVNYIIIGQSGPCNFAIAFSVIALILYSLASAAYHGITFWMSRNDTKIGFSIWNIPFLGINAVIGIISLVMACILSVGYSTFCNSIEEPHNCEYLQDVWTWYYKDDEYKFGAFHDRMTAAIASSWIAFIVFLCQIGLGILRERSKRSHKQNRSMETSQAPANSAI